MEKRVNFVALNLVTDVPAEPDRREAMRIAEALLFASPHPLSAEELKGRLPENGTDVGLFLRLS